MTTRNEEQTAEGDRLYEQYGKPLEEDHWGEYLVVTPEGEWILGATDLEALEKADASLHSGGYLFKVGEIVLGKIR